MVDEPERSSGTEAKRGRIEVRGGQPLVFVDGPHAAEGVQEPPPELRHAASQVAKTIKSYRDAAKSLLNGKYSHLRKYAPNHLREACDIAIICCRDGVIVRYDLGTEGATKIRAGAIDATLTELAPKFSDSLIHFPLERGSYDPGPDGIKLELTKVDYKTGATESISTVRLVIMASLGFDPSIVLPPPPSRPPCLVSCTNELQVVVSGMILPADSKSAGNIDRRREFLAQGAVKLQVAWQALEVYPAFQDDSWKPDFAPLWAETDLLAAVARRHLADTQLAAIDPNAAARRAFKSVLEELAALLDGPEEPAHQFLKQHPEILCPANTASWSKLPLGAHVTDFVFREPSDDYLLVEIESPLREVFRKDGQQREELTHAINQIIDWRIFIEDNLRNVQQELGLAGISANPRSLIVIGRSASLSDEDRRKLATLQSQIPRLRILTYDELVQTAKAVAENLFGPLDIAGQNLQIYYPPTRGAAQQ
jgi:hypothetical protein